ncbi:hypothetical protein niasHT_029648 [Heterodera trifolii]|uniref:Uncharacterized protein n=1 Tax=Heterodera trifolii TaxID=157864 RepID=A0ABD2K1K7_9BILA
MPYAVTVDANLDEDQREENAQYVLNGTSYKALIPRLPEHRNGFKFFFQLDLLDTENVFKEELNDGQFRYIVSVRARVQNGRESVRQYFAREGTTETFEQSFECRLNFVHLPQDPTYDWDVLQITYSVDSILSNWNKLMYFIFDDVISRIENGQVPDRPGSPPSLL